MDLPTEPNQRYTYADYCTWDDDFKCELIDGRIYVDGQPYYGKPKATKMMSPAPTKTHQAISMSLARQLSTFLHGKPCKVFAAPFDVRLTSPDDDDTVVQPDLLVVCDDSKLDEKGCMGAPDMIIEILSPSSKRQDKLIKFRQYQNAGVREYWIVDPESKTVSVHLLENGKYIIHPYGNEDTAPVSVLEGCEIILQDVFTI